MKRWLRILLLIYSLHVTLSLQADTVEGIVVDAETRRPLVGVSVKAETKSDDWSSIRMGETDSLGHFKFEMWREGRTVFTFSFIGYRLHRSVGYVYGMESKDTLNIGTIALRPTAIMLQKVEVSAKMPRITMVGDTVVFHPEAFKLKDGDRLDVLIRKLPGVEQRDGKLFWNGKPIRLMMNGKDLFGGSSLVGQLPAEVAEKIKLYDKQSELAKHTQNDDGNAEQVLDIQVKPGFLDKWYGYAIGNVRTKREYKLEARAFQLSDKNPVMLFGNLNNENLATELGHEWYTAWDIDHYGRNQYATANYQYNWETKGTDAETNNYVNVGPSMAHRDGWGTDFESTDYFLPGQERSFSLSRNSYDSHELAPKLLSEGFFYTDSINQFEYSAAVGYTKTDRHSETLRARFDTNPYRFGDFPIEESFAAGPGSDLYHHLVMHDRSYQSSIKEQGDFQLDLHWTHFMGRKGSYGVQATTNFTHALSREHYNRSIWQQGNETQLWQYGRKPDTEWKSHLTASLSYWLGKKLLVDLSNSVGYDDMYHRNDFYADTNAAKLRGDVPTTVDETNSLRERTHAWNNTMKLGTTVSLSERLKLKPQLSWIETSEKTTYHRGRLDTVARRTSSVFSPEVKLLWKNGRKEGLDLSWNYTTTLPALLSTLAYEDTTDPLYISYGNAALKRQHDLSFGLKYHRMFPRKQLNLLFSVDYKHTVNPLTTAFSYDDGTGVYRAKPMNVRGGNSYKAGLDYDQGLGVYWRVHNNVAVEWAKGHGYLLAKDFSRPLQLNPIHRLSFTDKLEVTYESEHWIIRPYVEYYYNRYRYPVASANNSYSIRSFYGLETTVKAGQFRLISNLIDVYRAGNVAGFDGHRLLWTVKTAYSFLKNKATIALEMADIFNREVNFMSRSEAYSRTEKWYETNHHYLSLSFGYQLDPKPKR